MKLFKIAAAALALLFAGPACSESGEATFEELSDTIEYVLELIADRELSDQELARASREYYALFDNACLERCIAAMQHNRKTVAPMTSNPGTPRDLLARQYYSWSLYFSDTQAGSFIQQLSNERDPIVLADQKSRRIMTKGDVLAVLNIKQFLRDGGEPTHREFTPAQIEAEIARYARRYIDGALKLPFRTGLAAELWAGVYQHWDQFDDGEKTQLRTYLENKTGLATMDTAVLQRLWDVDEPTAAAWKYDFDREQRFEKLAYIGYINMMGAIARGINDGEAFWRW